MTKRILIVDDDETVVNLLATIIEMEGMVPLKALSAKEAFAIMGQGLPDLVLLDIMMPQLDGFEVLAMLRKEQRTKQLPVIILTGITDKKNMIKGWREQADAWITKPFDPMQLIAAVRQVLARSMEERMEERARNIDELLDILGRIESN